PCRKRRRWRTATPRPTPSFRSRATERRRSCSGRSRTRRGACGSARGLSSGRVAPTSSKAIGGRRSPASRWPTWPSLPASGAAPALPPALRLEWRLGNEANAATLFYTLAGRPEWNATTFRAGLFMAASDVVRGRADRARTWLDRLLPANADDRLELAYWRGR